MLSRTPEQTADPHSSISTATSARARGGAARIAASSQPPIMLMSPTSDAACFVCVRFVPSVWWRHT